MTAGTAMAVRPQLDLADVDPERRAAVALDEVLIQRRQWEQRNRRPHALSPREALAALQFEALVVWSVANSLLHDARLPADERGRLMLALQRIDAIVFEVIR